MSTDPWNSPEHAKAFDFRAKMPLRMLKQDLSRFNDVQMLQRVNMNGTFLEVGCATGEMYRYVHSVWPDTLYWGVDVSAPSVQLAVKKYGTLFAVMMPKGNKFGTVYCKDVIQHAENPYIFIQTLVDLAYNALVFRCRTNDDRSYSLRQRHYGRSVPYEVLSVPSLTSWLQYYAPKARIVIEKHPGPFWDETSVMMWLRAQGPGVSITERPEIAPAYSLLDQGLYWLQRQRV